MAVRSRSWRRQPEKLGCQQKTVCTWYNQTIGGRRAEMMMKMPLNPNQSISQFYRFPDERTESDTRKNVKSPPDCMHVRSFHGSFTLYII